MRKKLSTLERYKYQDKYKMIYEHRSICRINKVEEICFILRPNTLRTDIDISKEKIPRNNDIYFHTFLCIILNKKI